MNSLATHDSLGSDDAPALRRGIWRLSAWDVAGFGIAILAALLVLAPLASLVWVAFQDETETWRHLAAYVIPVALRQTAGLLSGVAIITAVIGIGTAWLVTTYEFPGRTALTWLLPLPLAVPTYIVAYVYVDVLEVSGPVQSALRAVFGWRTPQDYWFPSIRSLGGAIFVFSFVLFPYVYLATRTVFQLQSASFIEAARVHGARSLNLVWHITLPLARPAIAVGIALALLETLNDIGASEYLGVQTLTLSIFTTWLNRGSLPGAAQIACVMLLIVAGLIVLEQMARRRRSYTSSAQKPHPAARIRLQGVSAWSAAAACFVPFLIGFAVPAIYLVQETFERSLLTGFDPALARHTLTTLTFAACATVLVLAIGFGAVIAVRLFRHRFVAICVQIAGIGYAVPGTVLALGLLAPLVAVDTAANWLTQSLAGVTVGLIVAGSGAAVVIAYVVRFLAISTGFAQAGLGRISTEFDDTARMSGAPPGMVLRTIHMPLARPAIWGAALLVFVDCLKELPATLLLRPLNVETLSTYIYQYATRGNFEEGSLAALMIVAVGIIPVIRIARHADLAIEAAGPQVSTE